MQEEILVRLVEVSERLERLLSKQEEHQELAATRWDIVRDRLAAVGYTHDLATLDAVWESHAEKLADAMDVIFGLTENDDAIEVECRAYDKHERMLLHVIAEAMGLAHVGSLRWTVDDVRGYDTPGCSVCAAKHSAARNATSGVLISKQSLRTRRRDRRHRQQAYERNKEHSSRLGIRCVPPSRSLYDRGRKARVMKAFCPAPVRCC